MHSYSFTGILSVASKPCTLCKWHLCSTRHWYPGNSCHLSMDRVIFVGACTETGIIAQFSCYSGMYIVLSTNVLDFAWYVYNSPFFWWKINQKTDISNAILMMINHLHLVWWCCGKLDNDVASSTTVQWRFTGLWPMMMTEEVYVNECAFKTNDNTQSSTGVGWTMQEHSQYNHHILNHVRG